MPMQESRFDPFEWHSVEDVAPSRFGRYHQVSRSEKTDLELH